MTSEFPSPDTITVRKGRLEDEEAIARFQQRMAMETEGISLDPETVGRGVRAVFEDPSKGEYWVAEEKGRTVGVLLTVPEWSDWRNGTVLWIHSLYVVPEFRGRGVFRRLYDTLRRKVRESEDLKGLRLYVDRRNAAAQAVYEKLGMNRDHYFLYEWLKDE